MVEIVDGAILEAAEMATRIDFGAEELAKQRLNIPARRKGGGLRNPADLRATAYVGAILDILPRCIGKEETGNSSMGSTQSSWGKLLERV